uniref:Uncharacterized protein n=1 Tax=Anopheles stephensi TaxID=30069 RepID=A0A182YQ45_ANOST
MQRSSSLYVTPNCGGSSVTIPPLLTNLSSNLDQHHHHHHHHQQQQQQQHQHYSVVTPIDTITLEANLHSPTSGRGSLKRKLPISELEDHFPVSVTVAPYATLPDTVTVNGPLVTKQRKDIDTGAGIGVELHEFPAFGQAFQGVSGIGQFYVIGPNDTNNNNPANALGDAHDPHHQQLATYIYDVPGEIDAGAEDAEVIPISEHHLTSTVLAPVVSDVVHHTNGIVLTDISSSTWTSTAELLDLDRKGSSTSTIPTNVHHHRYSIQYSGGGGGPTGGNSSPYNGTNNQSSASNWSNSGEPCRSTSDGSSPRRSETTAATTTTTSATTTPASALTNGMKTPERLASQTPDTPEDCKNLSWLLNFKLDDIPNLSPRSNRKQRSKAFAAGTGPGTASQEGVGGGGSGSLGGESGTVAIEEGDLNVGENVTIESSNGKSPKKPPFTYTELIEYALEEQGDLTVAAIYQWISDHFPYYKSHDDRWKNSVRHNLSINPHFRKGRKSSHGSGHLWTISSRNSEDNFLAWEHKKQRFEWFFKMEANARMREVGTNDTMTDAEVAAATASLAQYVPKSPTTGSPVNQCMETMNPATSEQHRQHLSHTMQQQQPHQQQQQHQQHQQHHHHHHPQQQITATYHEAQTLYADIITSAQFKVTARTEEIKHPDDDTFNGLRRGGDIQIDRPTQTIQTYEMLDSAEYNIADYLNPVPKEEIVQECGLRSVALDPAELGINIPSATGQDDDILFDDFNLNYFGNNIMT